MALSDYRDYGYSKAVWDNLMTYINNSIGVAALMGNLYAESGIIPYRCQGDFSSINNFLPSKNYTKDVDSGVVSEYDFVEHGLYENKDGYGLAQWTYYTRKQGYYNAWKSGGYSSIGSLELALFYLKYELENDYTDTLNVLKMLVIFVQLAHMFFLILKTPIIKGKQYRIYGIAIRKIFTIVLMVLHRLKEKA